MRIHAKTRNRSGFTIIEVIVALAIIAVIAGISISSFSTYDSVQRVKQAAFTLRNNLRFAQTSAISSLVPTPPAVCDTPLFGYVFHVSDSDTYQILARCATNTYLVRTIDLPKGIVFQPLPADINFQVLTNGSNGGTVTIVGGSTSFTLSVSTSGSITGPN